MDVEWFLKFLDEKGERLRQESLRLAQEDRRDEGDLVKIRANVCGICRSVLQTLGEEKGRERLMALRKSWETSHAEASAHKDTQKVFIETVKLEALDEIIRAMNERDEV